MSEKLVSLKIEPIKKNQYWLLFSLFTLFFFTFLSPQTSLAVEISNSSMERSSAYPAYIEIKIGTNSFKTQLGYEFKQFGSVHFTESAVRLGLQELLLDIKTSGVIGNQLVESLIGKGDAIVWEAARLQSKGDLVLQEDIFGYMDKNHYHSGLMRLNHNALQYIIIDVTPVSHETIEGEKRADLRNIMVHEAIHAILPNNHLIREYKYGRALNELMTVFYTNQIRSENQVPLRISYGDPLTQLFDEAIREGLKSQKIQPLDLIADLGMRLVHHYSNSLYEPRQLDQYGVSKNLINLFEEHGLLIKNY